MLTQAYRRGSKEDKNMIPPFLKSTIIMQYYEIYLSTRYLLLVCSSRISVCKSRISAGQLTN